MNDILFLHLAFGVLVIVLWWMFMDLYRKYRVDLLRQRLFHLRGELFEYAEGGHIDFNSRAYGLTRETLNGMIRFAHELSFVRLLIMMFTWKFCSDGVEVGRYEKEMAAALKEETLESKKKLLSISAMMHVYTLTHITKTSVVLAPIAWAVYFWLKFFNQMNSMKIKYFQGKTSRSNWANIDAYAYEVAEVKPKSVMC